MITLTLKRDSNGNKVLQVKPDTGRAFSVQTLGNLPTAHSKLYAVTTCNTFDLVRSNVRFTRCGVQASTEHGDVGIYKLAWSELYQYVRQYGTPYQRQALGITD